MKLLLLSILTSSLLLTGCGTSGKEILKPEPTANVGPSPTKPSETPTVEGNLLTFGYSGGLCASDDGNGSLCNSEFPLTNSGKINGSTLSTEDLNSVKKNLESISFTDFSNFKPEGDCGSSPADGSDAFIKINRVGTFESCENLPEPADAAVDSIINTLAKYTKQ